MKWDSWLDQEPTYTDDQKNQFAKYMHHIFGIPEELTSDMRQRAIQQGNPNLKLLLYWTMRKAWKNTKGVTYTEEMLLHDDWPNTNGTRIVACEVAPNRRDKYVVDIGRQSLLNTVADAISRFGSNYDGVHFDSAAWDIYYKGRGNPIGLENAPDCRRSYPESWARDPENNYPGKARGFAVAYHQRMQLVIDPQNTNMRLHIANGIPKNWREWNQGGGDTYLPRYFNEALIDGMQMDGAVVPERGNNPFAPSDIAFQLSLPQRFVEQGKYFLFKAWAQDDDELEYDFGAYLLVADGRYVLYGAAGRILDFKNDPVLRALLLAPLGNALGSFQPVSGLPYTYMRSFEHGLVLVNADEVERQVKLLSGRYKDVRRPDATYEGTITLPKQSARILIMSSPSH
jgi:hypothetical protein